MDSHYYLTPDSIATKNKHFYPFKQSRFLLQGAQFPSVPGNYLLPMNEGKFRITVDQRVVMQTTCNGHEYKHPNAYIRDLSGAFTVDLGWYTALVVELKSESYVFTKAPILHGRTPTVSL
jgi:hypothetical protein